MRENKSCFGLYNYLDIDGSPEEVIEKIIKKIPDLEDIGFAGYLEKEWLKKTLERLIPDREGDNQNYLYDKENWEKIKLICERVIEKCEEYLEGKIHIFLFPTFDKFTIKNMNGVSGFCPWSNTIFIFINFTSQWKKYLAGSIAHELAHALSPYCKPDASIGSWLVLEGMAENFKDFILHEKRSTWANAITEEESWKIFEEIKNTLGENDFGRYNEVFYGTGKYPLWAGYTIGYYLIKRYLKENSSINWNELLQMDPIEILGRGGE